MNTSEIVDLDQLTLSIDVSNRSLRSLTADTNDSATSSISNSTTPISSSGAAGGERKERFSGVMRRFSTGSGELTSTGFRSPRVSSYLAIQKKIDWLID